MSKFPRHISALDHLRGDKRIRFIEQEVHGFYYTIVSYMVADTDMWKLDNAIECRGITFDDEGFCVCAPFEKFFNMNENEWSQEHDLLVKVIKDPEITILEKRDGSMLTPILVPGHNDVVFKTKKSFYSDVAKLAQTNVDENLNNFCRNVIKTGFTPIFEFTDRSAEIVINYGDLPKFVLLAVRSMIDGHYMNYADMMSIAESYKIAVIPSFPSMTMLDAKEQVQTKENFEGWVLWFKDDTRFKIKTDWYRALHHVKTDLRERDIALLIAEEKVDDIKSVVAETGMDLKLIEVLEHRVALEFAEIESRVEELFAEAKQLPDRKSMALAHRTSPWFGLMMKMYDGAEPDIKGYWKKNYLDKYTLKSLYNPNFGGDE